MINSESRIYPGLPTSTTAIIGPETCEFTIYIGGFINTPHHASTHCSFIRPTLVGQIFEHLPIAEYISIMWVHVGFHTIYSSTLCLRTWDSSYDNLLYSMQMQSCLHCKSEEFRQVCVIIIRGLTDFAEASLNPRVHSHRDMQYKIYTFI